MVGTGVDGRRGRRPRRYPDRNRIRRSWLVRGGGVESVGAHVRRGGGGAGSRPSCAGPGRRKAAGCRGAGGDPAPSRARRRGYDVPGGGVLPAVTTDLRRCPARPAGLAGGASGCQGAGGAGRERGGRPTASAGGGRVDVVAAGQGRGSSGLLLPGARRGGPGDGAHRSVLAGARAGERRGGVGGGPATAARGVEMAEARLAAAQLGITTESADLLSQLEPDMLALLGGGADRFVWTVPTDLERRYLGEPGR